MHKALPALVERQQFESPRNWSINQRLRADLPGMKVAVLETCGLAPQKGFSFSSELAATAKVCILRGILGGVQVVRAAYAVPLLLLLFLKFGAGVRARARYSDRVALRCFGKEHCWEQKTWIKIEWVVPSA